MSVSPDLTMSVSPEHPIAYVCAEYALDDNLPIYAGGLGVLAGDILLEAQDMEVEMVALGLLYTKGFIRYPISKLKNVNSTPEECGFDIVKDAGGNPIVLKIALAARTVSFQAWSKVWGSVTLYLLDTNIASNTPEDRSINANLYPEDFETRISQDMILGLGSVLLLEALNITPSIYHLNEGHTSLVALGLALQAMKNHPEITTITSAIDAVRPRIVGTKHTILPGAGVFFTKEQSATYFGKLLQSSSVKEEEFFSLGASRGNADMFSTTDFLLRSCVRTSAVSHVHAEFEQKECLTCDALIPIVNGVSKRRWMREGIASDIDDEALWVLHQDEKKEFARHIEATYGKKIEPESLLVVWARRIAQYKQPLLLFEDIARLRAIAENSERPVTFIMSGNAYGFDAVAMQLLETLQTTINNLALDTVIYLPDYSIELSKRLIRAADVWINTPQYGNEASGTSGMKSALNGCLQCSVADGWIGGVKDEEYIWKLSSEHTADSLYTTLEQGILPMFYTRDTNGLPREWIGRMQQTRKLVLDNFTTRRMLTEYISQLYFP